VAETKTNTIEKVVGPFSDVIRPFTINSAGTLVFVNTDDILGFEIGDVKTGKKIHRVEVPMPWTFEQHQGEFTPAHGVAMSPDEKEIWVVDSQRPVLHVFDATVMPPVYKMDVKLTRRGDPNLYFMADGLLRSADMFDYAYWLTFGLDGKHVFASTGDVIDTATKTVVATLKDEYGRPVHSEKIVEVMFRDGKPIRTSDQFGYGEATAPANAKR
jgi:DNA-binding beta-propeller fold protein YncE